MSWFRSGGGLESVVDLTESGGRLVGDGLSKGGRLLGSSIQNIAVGAAMVTHHEPTIKTIQQAACATADLVHDACLVASATIWLLSEIPGQTYHALNNTSQPLQELYLWDWRNINSIINQAILSSAAFITPIPWLKAVLGAFQGVDLIGTSKPPFPVSFPGEKWYFINGIATDRNWLEKNIKYLEQRFHQPVTGVYNGTAGMTADLVTCILNRNAHVITKSVREVVNKISSKLQRLPADRRIRIMAHSQGTLILNLALEQLYHNTTDKDRKRLLIHTFASCSTDFPDYGYGILEHYANEHDGVSKLGVLDRIYGKRYQGTIYTHLGAAGHLLNTCYSLNARDYTPVPDSTIHPDSLLALPNYQH